MSKDHGAFIKCAVATIIILVLFSSTTKHSDGGGGSVVVVVPKGSPTSVSDDDVLPTSAITTISPTFTGEKTVIERGPRGMNGSNSEEEAAFHSSRRPRSINGMSNHSASSSSSFCYPVQQAVQQYLENIAQIRTETPKLRRIIIWRMLKSAKSGLGSNMKGLVNLFAIAMALNAEFVIESDCPEFADYFSSVVVRIEPNVGKRQVPRCPSCHTWFDQVPGSTTVAPFLKFSDDNAALEHAFYRNPRFSSSPISRDGGVGNGANTTSVTYLLDKEVFQGQVATLQCDRQFLLWFQDNEYLLKHFHQEYNIPVFDAAQWAAGSQEKRSEGSSGRGKTGTSSSTQQKSSPSPSRKGEEKEDGDPPQVRLGTQQLGQLHPSVTLLKQDPMKFPSNVHQLGYHPALLFGCLFDQILDFSPDVKEKVRQALRLDGGEQLVTPANTPPTTGSGDVRRLGIQLRSGRSVGWSDTSRIRKTLVGELQSCLASKIKRWVQGKEDGSGGQGQDEGGNSSSGANNKSQSPSNFEQVVTNQNKKNNDGKRPQMQWRRYLYVTSDSKKMKVGLEAQALAKEYTVEQRDQLLLQPFDSEVYSHTGIAAKSKMGMAISGPQGDRKVVVDFATLMEFDELWVTRSSFGEVPAWIAASRRPSAFQWRLVMHACRLDKGGDQDPDCSTMKC